MLYLTEKDDRPGQGRQPKDATMPIELKCYATLAPMMPDNAGAFPITPGETVLELATRLQIPHGEIKIVFVNGLAAELDRPLADGDRVGIFPPVGGG